MPLDGAFTALLLLVSGASAGIVLPPTNVSVSCQNSNVTVSWDYSGQQPPTTFSLSIGDFHAETSDRRFDLSRYVWASESRYLDVHFVAVSAVRGGERSEPVKSNTFSYNVLKMCQTQCVMLFPPVDLNLQDSGATVSFRNPFHFYSGLEEADKPDSAVFKFTAASSGGGEDVEGECKVKQRNCKLDVSFVGGAERCVRLRGGLFAANSIGEIKFNQTERICPRTSAEVHVMLLIALLSIVVVVVVVVTVSICLTKAWRMKDADDHQPKALEPSDHGGWRYYTVSNTDISAVSVVVNKPLSSPSVSSEDDGDLGFRRPANLYVDRLSESSDHEQEALVPRAEAQHNTDEDSADSSEKTECVSLDLEEEEEEEEEVSPYDCPQNLQVDLGDGDMATAYTRR